MTWSQIARYVVSIEQYALKPIPEPYCNAGTAHGDDVGSDTTGSVQFAPL